MFYNFAQHIGAAGQARAMARLAQQQQREFMDEMQKRQEFAYDAERYPHFIDLPAEKI
jgi:hypothetical protein